MKPNLESLTAIAIELDDLAILLRGHGVGGIAEVVESAKQELETLV